MSEEKKFGMLVLVCGFVSMSEEWWCEVLCVGGLLVYVCGYVYMFILEEVCKVGCCGGSVVVVDCIYMFFIG